MCFQMKSMGDQNPTWLNRRTVLKATAGASAALTMPASATAVSGDEVGGLTGSAELYRSETKVVTHSVVDDTSYVMEVSGDRAVLHGLDEELRRQGTTLTDQELETLSQDLNRTGDVSSQLSVPGLEEIWPVGYETYAGVRNEECPNMPFYSDYEFCLYVDTPLPEWELSEITGPAVTLLCEIISQITPLGAMSEVDDRFEESYQSNEFVSPNIPHPVLLAVAALIFDRGCHMVLEPLVGVLAHGGATLAIYDAHDPTSLNFPGIAYGNAPGQAEIGEIDGGMPVAMPGAHLAYYPPGLDPEDYADAGQPDTSTSGPYEVSPGETATITADASSELGDIEEYQWHIEDEGTILGETSVEVSPPGVGSRMVRLQALDEGGRSGYSTHAVGTGNSDSPWEPEADEAEEDVGSRDD